MKISQIPFVILGLITLFIGVIGIFIPVLPTTPFLLVSTWSFLKSSKRLYNWLINHKVLGFYVKNYIQHRGTTRKAKIITITILWITIFISIVLSNSQALRIALVIIATLVSIHVLTLKTIK